MDHNEQIEELGKFPVSFKERVAEQTCSPPGLQALTLKTLQVNLGRLCNQSCRHCHLQASPTRTEVMDRETVDACIRIIGDVEEIETVDITGGAPEMNPHFEYLVDSTKNAGKHVIDRCNLTVLNLPEYEHLPEFLAAQQVEIVASFPHYARLTTDRQRGTGVYEISIAVLKRLNALGYGDKLPLNLVYNPGGLFLSGDQASIEREFRKQLSERHGIVFSNLLCLNNFPVGRFLEALKRSGKFEQYMSLLVDSYNGCTVDNLMCRHQISIAWDGRIYDCDFNQMLGLTATSISQVDSFDLSELRQREIRVANHCFACTAGSGSSCGGEII